MNREPMSVGNWIGTMLLMLVPIVNIILLCIWAFGNGDIPESKKNWARASFIFGIISMVLSFILSFAMTGLLYALM